MKVGSLFSGIGGLDLGLERAGMEVVWQSEIDPYASKVLAKHWPHVPNLGDITKIEWSTVEPVDVICGGYPCQPFSLAGVRRGEADARHLWPYFADALRVVRPRWALLENVPGHLSLGFGRVLGDLAELGFDAWWDCIPAAAVGAPHLRYRVFVVAHAERDELRQQPVTERGSGGAPVLGDDGSQGHVAYARGSGRVRRTSLEGARGHAAQRSKAFDHAGDGRRTQPHPDTHSGRLEVGAERYGEPGRGLGSSLGSDVDRLRDDVAYTDQVGLDGRTGFFGPSGWGQPSHGGQWAVEPDVGRVAHGVPSRVDRLRCLGNAVVPQVAEYVGRRIMASVVGGCGVSTPRATEAQCQRNYRPRDVARFMKYVIKTDTCWQWIGAIGTHGYGRFNMQDDGGTRWMEQAHRFAYRILVGPVPSDLQLDHLCRNRACVNPAHLEPVTNRENGLRGSGISAQNAAKTHCVNGHPFDDRNTYIRIRNGNPSRQCRACVNERARKSGTR